MLFRMLCRCESSQYEGSFWVPSWKMLHFWHLLHWQVLQGIALDHCHQQVPILATKVAYLHLPLLSKLIPNKGQLCVRKLGKCTWQAIRHLLLEYVVVLPAEHDEEVIVPQLLPVAPGVQTVQDISLSCLFWSKLCKKSGRNCRNLRGGWRRYRWKFRPMRARCSLRWLPFWTMSVSSWWE